MKYLVSFALGPVQDFIAAARKTRDLYAGSWVLSELSKAAGLKLLDHGADLIFPAAESGQLAAGSGFRAVNRLLAIVETDDPSHLADEVRNSAIDRLIALGDLPEICHVRYDKTLMANHLKRSLEFYSAWVPYDGIDKYKQNRAQVEEILASRKLLNSFVQHDGEGGRRKSSLDGARETVILDRGKGPSDLILLREGEELDGTGFLKRFVSIPNREARFESTIELAGMPYEAKVKRMALGSHKIHSAFDAIKLFARNVGGISGDKAELLFEHESREIFKNDEKRNVLNGLRDELYKHCGRPDTPYLALLAADGDSMGQRISALGLDEHKKLSGQLSAFANEVREILIRLECVPVFTGGDDVRAAIPLHRLFEAIDAIRNTFQTVVRAGPSPFTLSAGVAIVHALDPLDEGMSAAKDAEKAAKKVKDKDAICFKMIPRTGAPVIVSGRWNPTILLLREIDRAFRNDSLSFGFAHELRELLGHIHADLDAVLPELAKAIAENKKKENSAAPDLVWNACQIEDGNTRQGLAYLMNCMLVTRKCSRAYTEAFGEPATL